MLGKIKSLVSDKRFPHFLPYVLVKKSLLKLKLKEPEKIILSLTFDVEYNPMVENKHVEIFLKKYRDFLEKNTSTLFVCGEIVKGNRELKKFRKCEIGLHGYAHELWGEEKWWLNKKPIDKKMKEELLKLSLRIFTKKRIKKPVSFRAPYMLSNKETLKILEKFGFIVDSSASTYLGEELLPSKNSKIVCLPVSANPIAKIKRIFLLPFAFYTIFNMQNFCKFDEERLREFIKIVTSFQEANGIKPHLVFLAHSYEFFKTKLDYCSPKNFETLKDIVKFLKENYEIESLRMRELAKRVFR
ncbi:MAG: polysaccharide deacetylase family protein [Candidatus Aenigmatarchaeota archaeon]